MLKIFCFIFLIIGLIYTQPIIEEKSSASSDVNVNKNDDITLKYINPATSEGSGSGSGNKAGNPQGYQQLVDGDGVGGDDDDKSKLGENLETSETFWRLGGWGGGGWGGGGWGGGGWGGGGWGGRRWGGGCWNCNGYGRGFGGFGYYRPRWGGGYGGYGGWGRGYGGWGRGYGGYW